MVSRRARWPVLIGGIAAGVALVGLILTFLSARNRERQAADTGIAAAVAGYLSLVTPVERGGSDYHLASLLSAAHTLASAPGWGTGLQIAWRGAPLLPDSIDLAPLETEAAALLADGHTTTHVHRKAGAISLAPLPDRDRKGVGWVAVWDSIPAAAPPPIALSIGLVTVMAIVVALFLARPGESQGRRGTVTGIAVVAMLLLAFALGSEVERLAAQSTDLVLLRAKQLAERAATIPRVSEKDLVRMVPGYLVKLLKVNPEVDTVRRVQRGRDLVAQVNVPLRSSRWMEISVVPREALLAGTWKGLLAWVALLGMGLSLAGFRQ
jgi:hypothetical protein